MPHDTGWVGSGGGGGFVRKVVPPRGPLNSNQPTAVLNTQCRACEQWFARADLTYLSALSDQHTGLHCKNCHADSMAGEIRKRSGASTVVCDKCGTRVEMHASVRQLDPSGRNVRYCRYCSGQDVIPPWCRQKDHHLVVTPTMENWDSSLWEYEPLPEWSRPALCVDCATQLIWVEGAWVEMDWPLLAREWSRADAR